MEFAASLPPAERVSGFSTKRFLKRYALRYLPRHIVYRRKRGLSVPISRWLRGPLRDWAKAKLSSECLRRAGLDSDAIRGLFAEHCRHQADHGRALWTLIVLSEWLDWIPDDADAIDTILSEPSRDRPVRPSEVATEDRKSRDWESSILTGKADI